MLDAQSRARLTWHCRRGMLELDLILQRVLTQQLDSMTAQDVTSFERLLTCTDPELYAWLMGHEDPVDEELKRIVIVIRNHH